MKGDPYNYSTSVYQQKLPGSQTSNLVMSTPSPNSSFEPDADPGLHPVILNP